ncbi:endosomal transmembrane epsin interactor 1 isoform X1 [Physeter macrocephalus]|uniref:Endosomal transmembrane epsin interactor 1 isoform X1 n=2 Tax=Physeter macrocephalus TaxID=9755 RepID=A0A2Y9T3J8_PHYMC|nr:endosomal transmembrane epsin interactor 1 isoform X1 [Physeter catodon]|eukprot:XP_023982664.1 protein FAM189A2 isoform X1 [Physeter catodon]
MSLPVVLPGSCCPVAGLSGGPQAGGPGAAAAAAQEPPLPPLRPRWPRAALQPPARPRCAATAAAAGVLAPPPSLSSRRAAAAAAAAPGSALLPARPLLSLGLLQLILGCCMVALSFGALSLSSSPQVKNSCPFWAGSSVILSGIIGLTTWKRPMILLVNLFVLLSVVCVLLNLAGFILGCQGAQFVSSVPRCDLVDLGEGKICFCCEEFQPAKCTDKENALKLFPVQPCSAVHLLLKKVLFALCALNALTTTVCLVAAALRYLQIFAARRSCIDESQISAEEVEEHRRIPDPDDFVPPVPPPSYFATFYSCTPRTNRRMVDPDVIPLPHIYGARIKGVEVFCPLDPPPPYEAVVSQTDQQQGSSFQMPEGSEAATSPLEPICMPVIQGGDIPNTPGEESASISTPSCNQLRPARSRRALQPLRTRSKSDPVLHHSAERAVPVLSCEAATQTEGRPDLAAVTLRRGLRSRASRCRPRSLIDYKSYMDTKLLVARFLEQSSCSMTPDIHELVENIKSVLKSDEEHMEEAITSASFLEQVMAPMQPSTSRALVLPSRRQPGLLHLRSCGDLSTFVPAGRPRAERRPQRAEAERPHSLIGVIRETVL